MKVHSGFYEAWTRGGFGTALVERVGELLSRCPAFLLPRVLFTGHSLGGALAVLASMDFVSKFPQYQTTVSVYTFGAPRVGNGPFAVEHRGAVPDCWSVVNNQDPIPRIPKGWFHGAGHRVVITPRGDLIIKPTSLEISVINRSGGVAAHHRLPSYSLSLFALLRAQFDSGKKLDGGAMGVTELAQRMDIGQTLVLKYAGIKEIMDARARRLPMPVEVYMARHARKHGTGPGGVEGRVISGESLVSTDISISMDGDTEGRLGHLDGHPRSDAGENDVETAEEEVEVERSTREEDALTDRGTLMSLSRISLIHGL